MNTPDDFEALAFIASVPWTAAGGEYDHDGLRHEYVARQHVDEPEAFTRFAQECRDRGYRRRFGKVRYRYPRSLYSVAAPSSCELR